MEEVLREKVLEDGPDWRWNRVRYLVSRNPQAAPRAGDPLIRIGCRYLSRRNRMQEQEDQAWLRSDYPDLYDAHLMYENPDSERWIVEAGILADQTDEFLAEYVATRPGVVQTYADYFFDIRSKLKAPGYITNRLLRPAVMSGAATLDNDLLLKMAAWAGGWRLVQETLDFRHLSGDSVGWLKTAFIHELVKKGWVAIRRLDVNNYTAMELINTVLRLAEIEHNANEAKLARKEGQTQESEVFAGLRSLLNSVQTGILRPEKVIGDEERALALLEANHGKDG